MRRSIRDRQVTFTHQDGCLVRTVTGADGRTWLATPDYHRVAAFKRPAVDPKPSLFSGRLPGNTRLVDALRVGRGKLRWPQADA